MKKHIYFLVLIATCCLILPSCINHVLKGTGNRTAKTVNPAAFNAIDISISSKTTITIQPGATPSVEICGYENHLKHILTKVENNKLIIYDDLKPNWTFGNKKEIEFKIIASSLEEVEISGATNAAIHGNLTGKDFKLDISGAVNVIMDSINVTDFTAEMSGAANIEVNGGTAHTATYEVSGAAKVKAFQLKTMETTTSISGAAKAEVTAAEKLTVDISGAGKVHYKGHPAITQDISGAGTITDAN